MEDTTGNKPWSIGTIAIISILLTPAVGGILVGVNQFQRRLYRQAAGTLALSMAVAFLYAMYILIYMESTLGYDWSFRLVRPFFVFPLVLASSAMHFPLSWIFIIVCPSALALWQFSNSQRKLVRMSVPHTATPIVNPRQWLSAWIVGVVVAILYIIISPTVIIRWLSASPILPDVFYALQSSPISILGFGQ